MNSTFERRLIIVSAEPTLKSHLQPVSTQSPPSRVHPSPVTTFKRLSLSHLPIPPFDLVGRWSMLRLRRYRSVTDLSFSVWYQDALSAGLPAYLHPDRSIAYQQDCARIQHLRVGTNRAETLVVVLDSTKLFKIAFAWVSASRYMYAAPQALAEDRMRSSLVGRDKR